MAKTFTAIILLSFACLVLLTEPLKAQQWFKESENEEYISEFPPPTKAETAYQLGVSYAKKGLVDLAIEEYQRAIEGDVDNPEAYFQLADAYRQKGFNNLATITRKQAEILKQ